MSLSSLIAAVPFSVSSPRAPRLQPCAPLGFMPVTLGRAPPRREGHAPPSVTPPNNARPGSAVVLSISQIRCRRWAPYQRPPGLDHLLLYYATARPRGHDHQPSRAAVRSSPVHGGQSTGARGQSSGTQSSGQVPERRGERGGGRENNLLLTNFSHIQIGG
jgi:hypothetical protein